MSFAKPFLFIVFFVLTNSLTLFSQKETPIFKHRNAIYGTVAISPNLSTRNINLEFPLATTNINLFKTINLRIGAGYSSWKDWEAEGSYLIISSVFISDANTHHLETSVGAAFLYNKTDYENSIGYAAANGAPGLHPAFFLKLYPAGTFGYRYHKPDGILMFRTGVGFPEIAYLGIGLAF